MSCATENCIRMYRPCTKETLDSNFNEGVINKISNFQEITPNFTYKRVIFKYGWNFLDQLLLPYKFNGSGMRGIHFFNFASCESLRCSSSLRFVELLKQKTFLLLLITLCVQRYRLRRKQALNRLYSLQFTLQVYFRRSGFTKKTKVLNKSFGLFPYTCRAKKPKCRYLHP